MSEAAARNGQPCARCGMKFGAHRYPVHPRACREWLTAVELREETARERDEALHGWMIDADMESQG